VVVYPHDKGIKLWLTSGVGLAIKFLIASDVSKSNSSSEVFPEIESWQRSPHQYRPEDFGFFILFCPQAAG
jgi:hypothetical protein